MRDAPAWDEEAKTISGPSADDGDPNDLAADKNDGEREEGEPQQRGREDVSAADNLVALDLLQNSPGHPFHREMEIRTGRRNSISLLLGMNIFAGRRQTCRGVDNSILGTTSCGV